MVRVHAIPFDPRVTAERVFRAAPSAARPAWLDSSDPAHEASRTSYVAWDPWATLEFRTGAARLFLHEPGGASFELGGDPFDALRTALGLWTTDRGAGRGPVGAPFTTGAVGYLSYELGGYLERLPEPPRDDLGFPAMQVRFYNIVFAYDHAAERGCLFVGEMEGDPRRSGPGYVRAAAEGLASRLGAPQEGTEPRAGDPVAPECDTTRPEYLRAVERARREIARGEIFQVNISQRFAWPVHEPPADLYLRLRDRHPACYGAFLSVDPGHSVLSLSPELYLKLRGREVETRPIKGTAPRSPDPSLDAVARERLLASEKDRSELIMIVDLERNDLGRVCEFGSVRADRLAQVESFATVHHLVARVTGRLRRGLDAVDLLAASFPGGSVTGAPKIRAMEIIADIETTARSVYTGSIGWIGLDGDLEMNIAIRTVLHAGNRAVCRVGGAVVADSDPAAEYEETLHKGRALFETLSGGALMPASFPIP